MSMGSGVAPHHDLFFAIEASQCLPCIEELYSLISLCCCTKGIAWSLRILYQAGGTQGSNMPVSNMGMIPSTIDLWASDIDYIRRLLHVWGVDVLCINGSWMYETIVVGHRGSPMMPNR